MLCLCPNRSFTTCICDLLALSLSAPKRRWGDLSVLFLFTADWESWMQSKKRWKLWQYKAAGNWERHNSQHLRMITGTIFQCHDQIFPREAEGSCRSVPAENTVAAVWKVTSLKLYHAFILKLNTTILKYKILFYTAL